jgi:hypothetical protein
MTEADLLADADFFASMPHLVGSVLKQQIISSCVDSATQTDPIGRSDYLRLFQDDHRRAGLIEDLRN